MIVRKEGGETLEQFDELMKRFGGNWESIMKQIVIDPKFATLKALLLDIASGVKTIDLAGENLAITLPANISKATDALKVVTTTIEDGALPASKELIKSQLALIFGTETQTTAYEQILPPMVGVIKKLNEAGIATEKQGIIITNLNDIKKRATEDEIGMIEKIGIAAVVSLGQSKLGAVAQATMSTYAGAAKSLELLGMPLAIPFIAMSIITGLKQVQAIMAVDIPSAARGAYLPGPAIIEAGHGPMGEVVLPLDKAPAFGGGTVHFNFYAPLIMTTGIAERDLEDISSDLFNRMEREASRRGYALNGA
jgi:hypothetical protein